MFQEARRDPTLRKFDSNKNFLWGVAASVDAFGCGDFDPGTDGQDMFTTRNHYSLNYSNTAPGSEWGYQGQTLNGIAYPADSRINASGVTWVRRLGPSNSRFLFFGASATYSIYRFVGETAVPCGQISSAYNSTTQMGSVKLWLDANGDGVEQPSEDSTYDIHISNGPNSYGTFDVDSAGDIWYMYAINPVTLVHLTFQGLNSFGVPTYSLSTGVQSALTPTGTSNIIKYDRPNDAMYLADTSGIYNSGVYRYDNWSTQWANYLANGTPCVARYHLALPSYAQANDWFYQGYPTYTVWKGIDVAGGYIFAWDEFSDIHVFDAALANPVLNIAPGPEVDGLVVWTDPAVAHAFKRSTGEYVLTQEDSGYNAKNLLYRWTPTVDTAISGPPTNLAALSDNGVIHLTWTGPRGQLTKYRVYRSTTSGGETLLADNVMAPDYNDPTGSPVTTYYYEVSAVNAVGESAKSNEASAVNMSAFAGFVRADGTTHGAWKGVYGALGNYVVGDANNLPSLAAISQDGILQTIVALPGNATPPGELQQPGTGTGYELYQWFNYLFPSFAYSPVHIDLNLTDGLVHQIAFYCADWGPNGTGYNMAQSIQISDAVTGAALDTRPMVAGSYIGGEYMDWYIAGHCKLTTTPTNGWTATVSGIFIDPVVDSPPTASLTAPANNAVYSAAPATIDLAATATANGSGGTISKVEFYNGATLLGTATSSPYTYYWTNVPVGTYTLTAKAYDNLSVSTTSSALKVNVDNPPTVSLTAPANNAVYSPAPATVALAAAATANASGGTISKVEFYNGATLLGTATSSPYTYSWTSVPVGMYTLTAKAYDNLNISTTSSVDTINVDNPPTVSLTAPSNNTNYVGPASVTITATGRS